MEIVKLSEYAERRRSRHHPPSPAMLRREARNGLIPGAFQQVQGGDWYVDLDHHDAVIRDRIDTHLLDSQPVEEQLDFTFDPVVAQILEDQNESPRSPSP